MPFACVDIPTISTTRSFVPLQSTIEFLFQNGRLIDEESGRCLDVATTECALIVYTSNWVNEKPPFVPVGQNCWYDF